MPVESCGFTLRPVGFFDRNPTLDVPAHLGHHCAPAGASTEPPEGTQAGWAGEAGD
jgi:primary-amine oxidase